MLGKKPLVLEPEDQVRLRPVLGIRPGVYLAIAGLLVVLAVLFFVLLYPGIARPGAMVFFSSNPAGAALRVDDVYAGSSPCNVFVPKGERSIEAVLPGFDTERLECTIPSRLFASALFPRRYYLNVTLTTADPAATLAMSAGEYAAWSFGGEPTAVWQVPLSLSEGVYRAGYAAGTDGILTAAARFAVTRAGLRDLVRASALAANGGNAPSPLSIAQSVAQAAAFLADNVGSAAWLAGTLPQDSAAVLVSSAWYQNQLASSAKVASGESLAFPDEGELPANHIRVGGLFFTGVGGGILVQGDPPHQSAVDAFLICTTEVSDSAYADFLDAAPRWRPDQWEILEKQGLVSNEYLADFNVNAAVGNRMDTGINSVSWHAAAAFCEWLTGKLPGIFSGWEIRLPTEAEWEYAAKTHQKWDLGIVALDSGAWEWCANPYSPLPFISAPTLSIASVGSPERPVRGGSWLNLPGSISPETRACLPPSACSPFVSFRPVIAPAAETRARRDR